MSTVDDNIREITIARYISVVGLTVSIYDAFLMFHKEYEQVWSSKRHNNPFFRNILIFNRYGMLATSILYLSTVSIPVAKLSREWCIGSGSVVVLMHVVLGICGDGLVIYVLCWTWNWRRDVSWMLFTGLAITTCTSVCFISIAISQFYDKNVTYFLNLGFIRTCYVSNIPPFFIKSFIGSVVMDCYALFFLTLNALSRPRSMSQGIMNILLRDGLQFLLVTLTMKLMNVIMTTTAPIAIALFFPTLGLAINSTATSRLYLRMCTVNQRAELQHEEKCLIGKEIPLALIPAKSIE